jgi:hypothetical protein
VANANVEIFGAVLVCDVHGAQATGKEWAVKMIDLMKEGKTSRAPCLCLQVLARARGSLATLAME